MQTITLRKNKLTLSQVFELKSSAEQAGRFFLLVQLETGATQVLHHYWICDNSAVVQSTEIWTGSGKQTQSKVLNWTKVMTVGEAREHYKFSLRSAIEKKQFKKA